MDGATLDTDFMTDQEDSTRDADSPVEHAAAEPAEPSGPVSDAAAAEQAEFSTEAAPAPEEGTAGLPDEDATSASLAISDENGASNRRDAGNPDPDVHRDRDREGGCEIGISHQGSEESTDEEGEAQSATTQTAQSDEPVEIYPHRVVEAILFASDSPMPPTKIAQVLGVGNARDVRKHVAELNRQYAEWGLSFRIDEIAGGYQMLTLPAYNTWLTKLLRARQETRLSQAALETLAIVAYKQPCTRADIEVVRGVAAGDMLNRLREINLVKIVGRAEDLGRPLLYGTTKRFLEVFGLPSLEELPQVEALAGGAKAVLTPIAAAGPPAATPADAAPLAEATAPAVESVEESLSMRGEETAATPIDETISARADEAISTPVEETSEPLVESTAVDTEDGAPPESVRSTPDQSRPDPDVRRDRDEEGAVPARRGKTPSATRKARKSSSLSDASRTRSEDALVDQEPILSPDVIAANTGVMRDDSVEADAGYDDSPNDEEDINVAKHKPPALRIAPPDEDGEQITEP